MDYHLILILAEVLDRVTLTGVAIKGQNHELLRKFIFQYAPGEGRVRYISGDGSESAVMLHSCFFGSLLYKLVEILDIDELLGLPSSMIVLILRAGM